MCRHALIVLIMMAIAAGPMAKTTLAQNSSSTYGEQQITSILPKVKGSAEEELPKVKKKSRYLLWTALGLALVALAAGIGAGGGDSSSSSRDNGGEENPPEESGTIEVGW